LGRNLRDHSAASIRVLLKPEYKSNDMSVPCINVVLRTSSSVAQDDIHLLPMHGSMDGGATDALVMAAVMTVRSEGSVALDPANPTGHPVIDLHMLTGPGDRTVMREAVQLMVEVLQGPGFAEIVDRIVLDEEGTSVEALRDEAVLDDWIRRKLGDYFHACGTCRMGRADDPAAVVDLDGALLGRSGVHVIDASVMPDVPAANTHWPTAMVAERLTARLMGRDLADVTFPDVS
jgi:choline dehydrogenase/5-(hydroxymethyl)furfural/furfural oxidase